MCKIFAVTSGKGGVGKSSVSVGLATAFCRLGKKVLLVDMDEGLRCLDLMLGVDQSTVFDLSDILAGKDFSDAVYPVKSVKELYLIPAPSRPGLIEPAFLSSFAKQVQQAFDAVFFDFPAGLDFSLYPSLPKETLFLTVANPDPVSVRDAAAVSAELDRLCCRSRLIVNRFSYRLSKRRIFKSVDDMIDCSGLQLLGIVPQSKALSLFSVTHMLPSSDKAAAAFLRIAKRLSGESILLPAVKKI